MLRRCARPGRRTPGRHAGAVGGPSAGRACRSRRREPQTPAAPHGPPPEFTSTSCRRWCSASACPATRARPWAGRWRRAARRDSRRCSRSASSAAIRGAEHGAAEHGAGEHGAAEHRAAAPRACGYARTRSWSRPPPRNWEPDASRWSASAVSPPPAGWRLIETTGGGRRAVRLPRRLRLGRRPDRRRGASPGELAAMAV